MDSGFTTRESTYSLIPTDGNMEAWSRLYQRAAAGLRDSADYLALQGRNPDGTPNPKLERLLDVDNLIEYMFLIFWGGNLDAPISAFANNRNPNNFHSLRSRNGGQGFRFFVWDAEHTLLDLQEDRTGPFKTGERLETSSPQWLWQQCVENAEFRLRVADLAHKHFSSGGVLSPESLTQRFLARAKEIESAVIAESARWGDVKHHFSMNVPPRLDANGMPLTGPFNREDDWRREIHRLMNDYLPKRTGVVLGQLFAQGLLPDIEPPRFAVMHGDPSNGTRCSLSAPAGTIYYTTDGSDPRLVGGRISPQARKYESPLPADSTTRFLQARVLLDEDWSALAQLNPSSNSSR